ncbi:MAG TPA: cytochrome P450 [Herpetosiphonaceae bacterium]
MTSSAVPVAAGGDPFGPAMLAEPYPHYNRVRDQTPIYWSPFLNSWVLMRYADVKAALLDPRLSSALTRTAQIEHLPAHLRELLVPADSVLGRWLVFQDHADHRRLRQLFSAAFTPRIVQQMRVHIQALTDDLIDAAVERGQMDLVADFAAPLPVMVITELLGAPQKDYALFKHWSGTIGMYFAIGVIGNETTIPMLNQVTEQMVAHIGELVAARRREPRDDLITNLIAAEEQGSRLAETELIANCILMLHAGHHSTTATIASGIWHLLNEPEQRELLRTRPELAESAVEEVLRCETAFPMVVRAANTDLELGGHTIKAGQQINLCLAAANYDPAQFPHPNQFDITRHPNPHLALSYGPHFCLGAPLARMEIAIAFNTLLRRLPDLRLADPSPEWQTSYGMRALQALPVAWTPELARPR